MARYRGSDGLLAEQQRDLADFWASADVEIDGDPQMRQAVRFALAMLFRPAPGRSARQSQRKG